MLINIYFDMYLFIIANQKSKYKKLSGVTSSNQTGRKFGRKKQKAS